MKRFVFNILIFVRQLSTVDGATSFLSLFQPGVLKETSSPCPSPSIFRKVRSKRKHHRFRKIHAELHKKVHFNFKLALTQSETLPTQITLTFFVLSLSDLCELVSRSWWGRSNFGRPTDLNQRNFFVFNFLYYTTRGLRNFWTDGGDYFCQTGKVRRLWGN